MSENGHWVRTAVGRFEGPLLRYARQITGDLDTARDVVQDTFMRLCREQPEQIDDHLARWLFTVCRNRALDIRRKEQRMKTMTDQQVDQQASRETEQSVAAENEDSVQQVLRAVDNLTDNQQEVVRLKFQNGLSYREISEITELSVSNVGYLLHTAVQKIRQQLNVECS